LDPVGHVVAIAFGFIADAPKEEGRVIAILKHFLLNALRLACAVLGVRVGKPAALRLQPNARTDGEAALLGIIKDLAQTIGGPGANAVAAGGHQFIKMLVPTCAFDEVRLSSTSDPNAGHDLHGYSLCCGMSGRDEKDD
jgi:hypothetical protein